ncbi:FtsX-like permease family protein [Actinoplanes sp. TBRC 11911]|uniref:ABC transporter permease n=1 Tax=Actinoplanes sp. TBRC 11911 TaxID=2729386 RepID=UPI00145EEDE1|nr:ABC transporter permease [Actinoplanes sp. TBRC 11911]NMO53533.1 FtsX-like permease family protein [Actinoplanes sp. TBRC 11911]
MTLAWQMVRHRFGSFAGTFVAIAAGVALVAGAGTLLLASRPATPERYSAAPVMVQSPAVGQDDLGHPEYRSWTPPEAAGLAARLGSLPGVTAAVPDPIFYVQRLTGGHATGDPETARSDGHAWSAAALGGYRLTSGRAPARDGDVAVGGATPGSLIEVVTAAGPATWTVTGTLDGPGLYVADTTASRLAGGVRVIGLTGTGDPETVAAAARGVVGSAGTVLTGGARSVLEPGSESRVRWIGAQLLIAMMGLSLFVMVFVVASTCALSTRQRAREIGLLRTIGATPGQVRRLMYSETLVVATIAGLVGVPAGALAAPLLARPMIDVGVEPATFVVPAQPMAWVAAFVLGVVVAVAGVTAAARRSSRISPLGALREAAADRRPMTAVRWIAGVGTTAGGVALLAGLPSMPITTRSTAGLGAAMLLLTAAAMLAPPLIVPLVRVVTWPWRRAATGMLVREGTLVAVRRVASTAVPVLLTVGFMVLLTGTVATIERATGADETAKIPVAEILAPDGTPGLSDAVVRAQSGTSSLPTRVLIGTAAGAKGYDVAGVDDDRASRGAVLNRSTARELKAAAGTTLTVRWADGSADRLPVTAVVADTEPGVAVPRDLVRRHDPVALTDAVQLRGHAVAAPGAQVMSARAYVQGQIDQEGRLLDLFLVVLIGLTVGYTGLAVANTLLMATAARRAEFRALRLTGATTGQVLRVTSAEAVLAVVIGTGLAAAVAAVSLDGMRSAVAAELNRAVDVVIPWPAALTVMAVCVVVAVIATAVPILRGRTVT